MLTTTTEIEKQPTTAIEHVESLIASDLVIGREQPLELRARDLGPPHRRALMVKRIFDVIGATIGLILSAPLTLVIALLITLESPGPALFAQRRVGRGGRLFRCLKFRTMREDAEYRLREDPTLYALYLASDHKIPLKADPRVTPLGRFLRRASLDELPQLLNVLAGTMSLVGPRPVTKEQIASFGPRAHELLSMRPGMTGLWAVSGRNDVGQPRRARLERAYVGRWSLRHDVCILLKTAVVVLTGAGAR